jgi:hypothetical protein
VYIREAYRLLQKSIIFVETEDIELEDNEEEMDQLRILQNNAAMGGAGSGGDDEDDENDYNRAGAGAGAGAGDDDEMEAEFYRQHQQQALYGDTGVGEEGNYDLKDDAGVAGMFGVSFSAFTYFFPTFFHVKNYCFPKNPTNQTTKINHLAAGIKRPRESSGQKSRAKEDAGEDDETKGLCPIFSIVPTLFEYDYVLFVSVFPLSSLIKAHSSNSSSSSKQGSPRKEGRKAVEAAAVAVLSQPRSMTI